jgi:hypothetical protein
MRFDFIAVGATLVSLGSPAFCQSYRCQTLADNPAITLEIAVAATAQSGSVIRVVPVVKNASNEQIHLSFDSGALACLDIKVFDESGALARPSGWLEKKRENKKRAGSMHLLTFPAGKTKLTEQEVSAWYDMSAAGKYTVQLWLGGIKSNNAIITVHPAESAQPH